MVQWLGSCALAAEGPGLIPGQGTKIPQAAQRSQKKKYSNGSVRGNLKDKVTHYLLSFSFSYG